jgi:hypothetical protein
MRSKAEIGGFLEIRGLKMRRLSLLVAVLGCLASAGAAVAAAPAGKAVGVDPSAQAIVASATKTLVVGADVGMGDKIVTGPTGQVQLVFNDDTHLVVGPSSTLVIQSYLLRNDKSVSKFAVSALGGTYRFITGKSDHAAYTINTPTGTIGVRGTAFDFTVGDPHVLTGNFLPGTTVALFKGKVILCDLLLKHCVTLDRKCDAGEINTDDALRIGQFQAMDENLRARFQYILSQASLLDDFHVDTSRLCFINTNPDPTGLAPTTGGGDYVQRFD